MTIQFTLWILCSANVNFFFIFFCALFFFFQTSLIFGSVSHFELIVMENEAGEFVDLYCPRKCSASNRIIHAKDHASIQISIAEVNPVTGRMADTSKSYALCGAIRRMGESDDCLVRLTKKDEIIAKNF